MGFVLTFDSAAWADRSFWPWFVDSRAVARAASYSGDRGVPLVSASVRLGLKLVV